MAVMSQPLLPATRRALSRRLAVAQSTGRAPSAVAALVRDGERVWCDGRGELPGGVPPAEVQYRIGSITKTFTAVLVLRLRDEGLVGLGDPLGAHLSVPHGGDATLAQLLAHTAGLASEARGPWWERTPGTLRPGLADLFGDAPRPHEPGRRHHYSNVGFALLGALVAAKRGALWHEVVREEICQPLGMRRTTIRPEEPYARGWAVHPYADVRQPEPLTDTGLMAPAGQLWSTAGDLCAFAAFLASGDDRVLGAASLAEMRRAAVVPEDPGWEAGYGLGMALERHDGRLLRGHAGTMPGFTAGLWLAPGGPAGGNPADAPDAIPDAIPEDDAADDAAGLAAVALTNASSGLFAASLAAGLLSEAARLEPAFPPPWRPMPQTDADPALLALTGAWYWGTVPFLLRLHAGRVVSLAPLTQTGLGASRFLPAGDGERWTGQSGEFAGETLRVVRREDGGVDHLDLGTFVLTRAPYEPGHAIPGGTDPAGWGG